MQDEEIIGIIYIPIFLIYLVLAVYGGIRHGIRKGAWIPSIIISLLRVVGGGLTIAVYTETNPSTNLIYAAYALQSIGVALLNGGFIRLLQLFYGDQLKQSLRLAQLLNLVGLIMGIVGSTQQDFLYLKIAAALYTASYLFGLIVLAAGYRSVDRLWYGIALVSPFLSVRIAYSWYSAFNFTFTPNFVIHLVLGLIMEAIIVGLFITIGYMQLGAYSKYAAGTGSRV